MDSELDKRPHSTPKRASDASTSKKSEASLDGTYSYSFNSTGDSTRSLLSVLSHSSVDSLSDHDISKNEDEVDNEEETSKKEHKDEKRGQSSKESSSFDSKPPDSVTQDDVADELDSKLNVFEKWLVKKIKEERKAIKKEVKKEENAKKVKEEEEKKKKERRKVIERRLEEWVTEHDTQDRYRKKVNKREELMKQEMKEEEKRRTKEREKVCREEWLAKKKEQQKLKATKEKEEKEKKMKEENERKERAKSKYEEWYLKSISKPRKVKNSYAYSEGTLKGYYDSAAYPLPTYCNPIPWKPIHIPEHSEEKRSKSRQRINKKPLQDPSPPMLFKSRTAKENLVAFGRPR